MPRLVPVPRIVVFGATGYTGGLVASALVAQGARPLLAGRDRGRLDRLADRLGGLDVGLADVARPGTIRDLLGEGDVLVSTVGPFSRWGAAAVEAAIAGRAHYLDSTGEPVFIRRVFEHWGPRAAAAGCGLITAFGYDFVPGNAVAAIALDQAGTRAVRVDVGYYITGEDSLRGAASGGTTASALGVMRDPHMAWRGGRMVSERGAARVRNFMVEGRRRAALSVGGSEHFGIPRAAPQVTDVNVYLGWFGRLSRPLQVAAAGGALVERIPGVSTTVDRLLASAVKGSAGGPDAATRARSGSHVVAATYDADGAELSLARLAGANGYSFTGDILAWGAIRVLEAGLPSGGALGPVEAFGREALIAGCAQAGLRPVAH